MHGGNLMRTNRQQLGDLGEEIVAKRCVCPRCKRSRTLKRLPNNFKCADIICDFCGFLAQVKAAKVTDVRKLPRQLLGAAWRPQQERMKAGIYFPLFIVLIKEKSSSVYYLSADLQVSNMFLQRKPLSHTAKKAGWCGFRYDLTSVADRGIVLVA